MTPTAHSRHPGRPSTTSGPPDGPPRWAGPPRGPARTGVFAAVAVVALHLLLAAAVLRTGSTPGGPVTGESPPTGPVFLELPRLAEAPTSPEREAAGAARAPATEGVSDPATRASPQPIGAVPSATVVETSQGPPSTQPAPTTPGGSADERAAADANRTTSTEAPTSLVPTSEAPPLPAGSPPRYRTQPPAPTTLVYQLRRGERAGRARLDWQFEPTSGYRLSLGPGSAEAGPGAERWAWVSAGTFDAHGLAPRRYADTAAGRERRTVNFQREAGRVSWSASDRLQPLPEGLQDRVSWLVQLAAVLNAEPALRQPGAEVELWVAGLRGEIDAWPLRVRGPTTLAGADGQRLDTLHIVLEPTRPWAPRIELWLDPQRGHLPARLSFGARPPLQPLDLLREDLAAPPASPSALPPPPRPGS